MMILIFILVIALRGTSTKCLSRERTKTLPYTLFEYDNFCNFILKFKLWFKKTTYIFISSLNLVTAHNFAVKREREREEWKKNAIIHEEYLRRKESGTL